MARRAFTRMELMVVVGIMAFLGLAATNGYNALRRGMAKTRAERFGSCGEFVAALASGSRGGGRPDMAGGAGIPECVGVARKILMTEYR